MCACERERGRGKSTRAERSFDTLFYEECGRLPGYLGCDQLLGKSMALSHDKHIMVLKED